MDLLDARNEALGIGAATEGGAGDELGGAAQAAQHVGLEVGVIPHPGQRQRMQHLQQQCSHATGEHGGEIAMHLPGRRVRTEQAGVTGRLQEVGTAGTAADGQDVGFDALAQKFHDVRTRTGKGSVP
jgi:alpha-L-fucosidase